MHIQDAALRTGSTCLSGCQSGRAVSDLRDACVHGKSLAQQRLMDLQPPSSMWLAADIDGHVAVQSSTNTLLSHTISLLINLWLIRLVGKNVATQPAGFVAKPAT